MLKIALAALTMMGLTAAAEAGPRAYAAANCTIELQTEDGWRRVGNACFMGRDYDTDETAVKMGSAFLLISRDPDEHGVAKLYTISAEGKKRFQGTAVARGPCWVGSTIKFCAP